MFLNLEGFYSLSYISCTHHSEQKNLSIELKYRANKLKIRVVALYIIGQIMLTKDEIQPIRTVLVHLVGRWSRYKDDNPEIAKEIVEHYNGLLRYLINTGWDDGLPLEAELPDELMPQEYLELLNESFA